MAYLNTAAAYAAILAAKDTGNPADKVTWAELSNILRSISDDIDSLRTIEANYVSTALSYSNPTWLTGLAWSKISGTPTTLAGYGITDAVDFNAVYVNPAFVGSLAWSKITGTPTTVQGYGIAGGTLSGTAGAGFLGYAAQSSAPSTPTSGFRLYANSANALSWVGANGFTRTFDGTANTANRTYTLPDTSGTFGLLGAAQTWDGLNTFTSVLNATGGIGTTGATNVNFFANNTLVGRIFQSTGRWSIGYPTPIDSGFMLDVNGSIRASSISASGELYTTSGVRLSNNNVGSALSSGQAIVASASTGWFDLYNSTSNGFGYRIFNGNRGQVFEITKTLQGYGSNLIYQNGGTFTDIEAAIVQINSTAKGVLLPRMTSAQRNSVGVGVTSIAVTNGGSGYTSAPAVNITLGDGYGATATAVVSGGVVTAVNITRAGNGYTSAPNIALTGGGGSGATATATIGGTPPTGLIIYDTTLNHLCFYNGTAWQRISHSPA